MNSLYVPRLNTAGQPQWIATAVLNGASSTTTFDIKTIGWDAANGNVVVADSYHGTTIMFGTTVLPDAPYGGLFVARLSAAGQWLSATGVAANNAFNTNASVDLYSATHWSAPWPRPPYRLAVKKWCCPRLASPPASTLPKPAATAPRWWSSTPGCAVYLLFSATSFLDTGRQLGSTHAAFCFSDLPCRAAVAGQQLWHRQATPTN